MAFNYNLSSIEFEPKTFKYNVSQKDGRFFLKPELEGVSFYDLLKNYPEKCIEDSEYLIGEKCTVSYSEEEGEFYFNSADEMDSDLSEHCDRNFQIAAEGRLYNYVLDSRNLKSITMGSKSNCDVMVEGLQEYHCKFYKKGEEWFLEKMNDKSE